MIFFSIVTLIYLNLNSALAENRICTKPAAQINCVDADTKRNLAQIAASSFSNDAQNLISYLKNKNFNCANGSAEILKHAVLCIGKLDSYSQPVRIYVPPNFTKSSQSKINLHFHGHRLTGVDTFLTNKTDTAGWGDYGARLVDSGSADVLVIPESLGNCKNYDNELAVKFKIFSSELEKTLGLENPRYRLSSHSGGGRILDRILSQKLLDNRVTAVGLYDTIYQPMPGVASFLKQSASNKLILSYIKNGSTEKQTQTFLTENKALASQTIIHSVPATQEFLKDHMSIMNNGNFSDFLKLQ